jgi:renalase
MAGAAAARRLSDAGMRVTIFDKSRGVGGRMATRRIGDLQFDHGAQYFTARGPDFTALVTEWIAHGHAAAWTGEEYVGVPGMTGPARALAAGLDVTTACTVSRLRRDDSGWTLLSDAGPLDNAANGHFTAVILAMPAPQAAVLAATAGIGFAGLDAVRYAPCWTLMLGFDGGSGITAPARRLDDPAIAWVARNDSKPGRARSGDTVVIHASPAWSRRHLELAPDEAAARLLAQAGIVAGMTVAPTLVIAHRWRYARVEATAATPCTWDAGARIGACGDWGLGPRVEAAFDSGRALADVFLAEAGRARTDAD